MSAPLAEGEILAGKYRIEKILGRGGMGVVVAATHMQLEQRVAIKLLLPGASADVVERFQREARAAVRLKSEHVARVIDVGELPTGAPYMVMEYLAGQDLSQLVRSTGALEVPEAVEYLLHACEAIAEAHAQGIIHRDLKPANLFLTGAADGTRTVKVLDFGISKVVAGADADEGMALTKTASVLGSPLYMSPEQMKSARQADARSDIWSLGAILYELLTARVPFDTNTFAALVLMVNMESPRPVSELRADVPPELDAAVLRCLEKAPDRRFQNVADLAWALAPFAPPHAQASAARAARTLQAAGIASAGPQSQRAMGEPLVAGLLTAMSTSAVAPPAAPVRSGGGKVVAILAAVLAVAGAATFFVVGRPHAATSTPAPAPATAEATPTPPPTAPPVVTPPPVAVTPAPAEPSATASASASAVPVAAPRLAGPIRQAAPAPTAAPAAKKNPLEIQLK